MPYTNLLAMEVITYNRPEVVEDVLENCAEFYKRCGVEIYYYDSSTNDETRCIVEKYVSAGFDNIIYVPLEPGTPVYDKCDMIYAGKGLKKRYKYIWISKDRAWVEESALREILETAKDDYDIILTATRPGDATFIDSAEELYLRWAPISTSINVALLSTKTLLKDYQIPDYGADYPFGLRSFGHFYEMFNRIAQIKNPRIARVEMNKRIHQSDKGISTWESEIIFDVWNRAWVETNDMLPEIYAPYKDYVLKKVAGLPYIVAERNRLIQLHEKGILIPENLPKALYNWERISDIPKEVVIAIANGEYDIRYDLSQISDRNQLTKLLVEMAGYIKNGKMAVSQIPFDDIIAATKIELVKDEDRPRRNIRLGAVETIFKEFDSNTLTSERAVELIQQLLGYII